MKFFLIFFLTFIPIFAESNILLIPLTASGSQYQNISMNALKVEDGIEFFSDGIDISGKKRSSKGGIFVYQNDFIQFSLYNLSSNSSLSAFDNLYPIDFYPKSNGYSTQNINSLSVSGNVYSFNKHFALAYYFLSSNASGQFHLYNYKTSPSFPQDRDLYFPDYQVKYNYKDISTKVGFNLSFEKIKIGLFVRPLFSEKKAVLKGNAFFIERNKSKEETLNSYIKKKYNFNEDYKLLKNPPLNNKEKKKHLALTLRFSFSFAKIFLPEIPAFDFTNIEVSYSKNKFSYSQRNNAMFHQNFGIALGFLYSQKGEKGKDFNILRNYEIGPIFRYAF